MIKSDIFIRLTGVNTEEQNDGKYKAVCPCILYVDKEKQYELTRVSFEFVDLTLEELALPAIYGRIMAKFSNPSFI